MQNLTSIAPLDSIPFSIPLGSAFWPPVLYRSSESVRLGVWQSLSLSHDDHIILSHASLVHKLCFQPPPSAFSCSFPSLFSLLSSPNCTLVCLWTCRCVFWHLEPSGLRFSGDLLMICWGLGFVALILESLVPLSLECHISLDFVFTFCLHWLDFALQLCEFALPTKNCLSRC